MPSIFSAIKNWLSRLARIGTSAFGRDQNMVRIRLRRQGSKGQPSYRIVVIDQRKARNGKYLENIGHYNPRTRPATEVIKEDRALYWLSVGAQPSDPVRRILDHTGTWERFQRFRAGESMEDLISEAEENRGELPCQKTKYPAIGHGESKINRPDVRTLPHEQPDANTDEPSQQPDKYVDMNDYDTTEPDTPRVPSSTLDQPTQQPDERTEENIFPIVERNSKPDLPRVIEGLGQETDESNGKNQPSSSILVDEFDGFFASPGKTRLIESRLLPNPLRDPDHRYRRKKEHLEKVRMLEPDKWERTKLVLTRKWTGKDTETRYFLEEEYEGGYCQICDCKFVFPKRDGNPYFEGVYILSYKQGKWLDDPGNILCLCANHAAQFMHGSIESQVNIREQIKSYQGGPEHHLDVRLIGKDEKLRLSERHIIDLRAVLHVVESSSR